MEEMHAYHDSVIKSAASHDIGNGHIRSGGGSEFRGFSKSQIASMSDGHGSGIYTFAKGSALRKDGIMAGTLTGPNGSHLNADSVKRIAKGTELTRGELRNIRDDEPNFGKRGKKY